MWFFKRQRITIDYANGWWQVVQLNCLLCSITLIQYMIPFLIQSIFDIWFRFTLIGMNRGICYRGKPDVYISFLHSEVSTWIKNVMPAKLYDEKSICSTYSEWTQTLSPGLSLPLALIMSKWQKAKFGISSYSYFQKKIEKIILFKKKYLNPKGDFVFWKRKLSLA